VPEPTSFVLLFAGLISTVFGGGVAREMLNLWLGNKSLYG